MEGPDGSLILRAFSSRSQYGCGSSSHHGYIHSRKEGLVRHPCFLFLADRGRPRLSPGLFRLISLDREAASESRDGCWTRGRGVGKGRPDLNGGSEFHPRGCRSCHWRLSWGRAALNSSHFTLEVELY